MDNIQLKEIYLSINSNKEIKLCRSQIKQNSIDMHIYQLKHIFYFFQRATFVLITCQLNKYNNSFLNVLNLYAYDFQFSNTKVQSCTHVTKFSQNIKESLYNYTYNIFPLSLKSYFFSSFFWKSHNLTLPWKLEYSLIAIKGKNIIQNFKERERVKLINSVKKTKHIHEGWLNKKVTHKQMAFSLYIYILSWL